MSPKMGKPPVVVWLESGGRSCLVALDEAMGYVNLALTARDVAAARQAAQTLHLVVDAAQAIRTLPDLEAQNFWADSLAAFRRCAYRLLDGLAEPIPRAAGIADLNHAKAALARARARMAELGGEGAPVAFRCRAE